MVQLVFDADDPREALDEEPVAIGYSSHEGAERADWDDDEKLERVDETHPVVYPGAGSHANKFTEALYLGSSAEAGSARRHAGLGTAPSSRTCDDPERLEAAADAFPGSSSRAGGASSSRRSSTGRPART